jgi:hypothetical protein
MEQIQIKTENALEHTIEQFDVLTSEQMNAITGGDGGDDGEYTMPPEWD